MASQNQSKPQANFFAIIPANVLWHEGLEASAKLFYASINAMTDRDGYCWASNRYFAELFNVDESTIKRWLESLHSAHVIWIQTEKKGMGWSRKIYTVKEMFTKAQKCPIVKNILPPSENAPTGTFQRRLKNEPYEGSKMSPYIDKVIDKEITTPQPPAKKVGGSFKKEIDPEKKKLLEPLNLTDQEKRRLSKFDTKNIAHAIAYNKVVEPEKSLIAQLM